MNTRQTLITSYYSLVFLINYECKILSEVEFHKSNADCFCQNLSWNMPNLGAMENIGVALSIKG